MRAHRARGNGRSAQVYSLGRINIKPLVWPLSNAYKAKGCMKQLTQAEFDALPSNRPLDVRIDGFPHKGNDILFWESSSWNYGSSGHYGVDPSRLAWETAYGSAEIDSYPIYHKLPDDYVEPSRNLPSGGGSWPYPDYEDGVPRPRKPERGETWSYVEDG